MRSAFRVRRRSGSAPKAPRMNRVVFFVFSDPNGDEEQEDVRKKSKKTWRRRCWLIHLVGKTFEIVFLLLRWDACCAQASRLSSPLCARRVRHIGRGSTSSHAARQSWASSWQATTGIRARSLEGESLQETWKRKMVCEKESEIPNAQDL